MWEYKVLEEVWCIENVLNKMSKEGWALEQILEQGSHGRSIVFKRPLVQTKNNNTAVVHIDGQEYKVSGTVAIEVCWLRQQLDITLGLLNKASVEGGRQPSSAFSAVYDKWFGHARRGPSPLLPFLEEFAAQMTFEEDQEMLKELGLD